MLRNIPIGLTLFRIAAIPGIVALLFLENNIGRYLACALFGIAAITDFFDGLYILNCIVNNSKKPINTVIKIYKDLSYVDRVLLIK